MGVGSFFINYTDGGGEEHTFKKYVTMSDLAGHWLAGDGTTIALSGATPTGAADNAGTMIKAWLKAYEFVAPSGSVIRGLGADFRETGGPGIVDESATFNVSGFTPAGGAPHYGPFPTGFIAARSRAVSSRRSAWFRFYTTGSVPMAQSTIFAANDIDPDFESWLGEIAAPAASNGAYVVWSGYSSVSGDWQGIAPYQISTWRIGAKNG